MVSNFADETERRLGSLLDRVPGYRGYRSKEDRRDADKRVRAHAATAFGQLADRVESVGRDLADQRRLAEIAPVDDLTRAIRHLADRVRTATYGYGGLFGDREVDATALDQLRLFDEGLLAGASELERPVADLEAAHSTKGDLATAARAGTEVVRRLEARLDLRGQVVETGKPAPEESVLRVLGPGTSADAPPSSHRAYDLKLGDALAILGDDFLVDASIAVSGGRDDLRLFRLGGGAAEEWLFVPQRAEHGLARLSPVAPPPPGQITIASTAYADHAAGSGDGQVSGTGGASDVRPVRYQILRGADDTKTRALILDWNGERQAFAGAEVHPNDVEVFGRPNGQLN